MPKTMFLKKVDAALGGGLAPVSRLVLPRKKRGDTPAKALVIRPGGIGDAVLLIPALLALKEHFPQLEITVLAEQRNGGVFGLSPAVDRLLLYDRPGELWEALRGGYDLVIDSEQWHRLSAVVARLTRAPVSIGFASNGRKMLFSHQVPYSHDDYEADSFLRLLQPLGIAPPPRLTFPFLSVPPEATRRVSQLLGRFSGLPYGVIFGGASIPERRWGWARYQQVAQHLALRGLLMVAVGGEGDFDEGDAIVRRCGGINLAGQTTLAETAAAIAGAAVVITGDTGILHIAVGLGVPTVSLFGPGIQEKWGPRGARDVVLNRRLSCSPCTSFGSTRPCPSQARCMAEISPAEVVEAVMSLASE